MAEGLPDVNMFKMCFNWKVMAGLAAVAAGVYLVAPAAFVAPLPLLFLAICPLSMMLMMKMMNGGSQDAVQPAARPVQHAATEDLDAELHRLQARETAIADQLEALRQEDRAQRDPVQLPPGSALS